MFCKNCGTEINDTAKFCPKCGNARSNLQQKNKIIEDNQMIFSLKPKFNILYQFLVTLISGIIALVVFACSIEAFWLLIRYPIIPIVFLVIYLLVKMIFGSIQYKNLTYNFYKTKVEYIDGFFDKEEKELKYKFVREVSMSQGILERICGIGTIKIYTNASSGGYNQRSHSSMRGRNGIYIHCIKNVQEQYNIIKQVIDEGTPEDE